MPALHNCPDRWLSLSLPSRHPMQRLLGRRRRGAPAPPCFTSPHLTASHPVVRARPSSLRCAPLPLPIPPPEASIAATGIGVRMVRLLSELWLLPMPLPSPSSWCDSLIILTTYTATLPVPRTSLPLSPSSSPNRPRPRLSTPPAHHSHSPSSQVGGVWVGARGRHARARRGALAHIRYGYLRIAVV